jgi:hypothetical protein
MDMPLPPLAEREVRLVATSRRAARSDASAAPADALEGRVKLGGPFAVVVTPEYVASSPDLRAFVEQEAAHSLYHLVHISVTFEPAAAEAQLGTAAVDLALQAPGASRRPVAWSMSPLQITDPSEVTSSLAIGPQLKLGGIELAGIARTSTRVRHENDVFLQAFRELRADPGWRLQRTSAMPLFGCFRFGLVVRSETGTTTELALTITATVFRRSWLRSYSYSLPDPLTMSAAL